MSDSEPSVDGWHVTTRSIEHPIYGPISVFDDADFISRTVAAGERWEPHIVDRMASQVAPGTEVLDIGANLGFSTLGLLAAGAEPAVVHCFEPVPEVHALLQRNVRRHANVTTYPLALGANELELGGYDIDPSNIGGTELWRARAGRLVAFTSLDKLLELGVFSLVRPVSVVKIDVECGERALLAGARRFFESHRPEIFIEIRDELVAEVTRDLSLFDYVLLERLGAWDYRFSPMAGTAGPQSLAW